jgi:hypothetical protein
MSEPAEQIPNFEVLTPHEADDYLKAASMVLSSDHGQRIEGVHVSPIGNPNAEKPDFVYIGVDVDGETGYRVSGVENGVMNHMTVSQLELSPGTGIEDARRVKTVSRIGDIGSRKGTYLTTVKGGSDEQPTLDFPRAQTPEDKAQAAAEFATMASDVKAALTAKLAGRPDLIDGIDATARRLRAAREKSLASRIFGRLAARHEVA